MSNEIRIKINDLRVACEKAFAYLESFGYDEIELPHEYFWDIPRSIRYEMTKKPDDFEVEKVSDTLSYIIRVSQGELEPSTLVLLWLSYVLRIIGEEIEL